jgi:hypothetical protein
MGDLSNLTQNIKDYKYLNLVTRLKPYTPNQLTKLSLNFWSPLKRIFFPPTPCKVSPILSPKKEKPQIQPV